MILSRSQIEAMRLAKTDGDFDAMHSAGVFAWANLFETIEAAQVRSDLLAEVFREYVACHGAAHADDCPGDDTCDCEWKPLNDRVNYVLGMRAAPLVRYVVHGTVVREEPAQPRPQAWPCPTAHDAEWLAGKLTERLKERAS